MEINRSNIYEYMLGLVDYLDETAIPSEGRDFVLTKKINDMSFGGALQDGQLLAGFTVRYHNDFARKGD